MYNKYGTFVVNGMLKCVTVINSLPDGVNLHCSLTAVPPQCTQAWTELNLTAYV